MKRPATLLILCAVAIQASRGAPATALAFHPEGPILASGSYRKIELRSLADGKIAEGIPCESSRVSALAFSADGRHLVVTGGTPGESGAALVLKWSDRSVLHRFTNFADLATSGAFSSDSTWLAVGSADASVALYPFGARRDASPILLSGHSGPVLGLAWSPDDEVIVTASADRSLKVWSVSDGKLLRSFSHHTEPVNAVVFRPRGNVDAPVQCASASDDHTVRVWQPKIGRMVRIIRGHGGPIFTVAYTPDGEKLFSAGREGVIHQLDTESDQVRGEWQGHGEPVYKIAISPDGKHLASGDWAGKVRLWRISDEGLRKVW